MAKSTKLIDLQPPQASMADHTLPPLMGHEETDSLVIRIPTEVLKGRGAARDFGPHEKKSNWALVLFGEKKLCRFI